MRTLFGATLAALVITCVAAPPALLAQQKTAKECRDEWRANKDANKAGGITEKDYVAKCRGAAAAPAAPAPAATAPAGQAKTAKDCRDEWRANKDANKAGGITQKDYVAKCRGETAQPAAAPAPAPAAAAPTAAPAGEAKTAKACRDEWRANKDANKAGGITEKDYVAKCRAGGSAAAPAAPAPTPAATTHAPAAPAPAPSATAPAAPAPTSAPPPARAPAPAAPTAAAPAKQAPPAATAPTGAFQFKEETQAKARCPADTVVWVNLDSKIYHFSGYRNYGKTKEGAYMCEKDALGEAFRAAENEKHP
jgi:hypothetical protein